MVVEADPSMRSMKTNIAVYVLLFIWETENLLTI